MVNTRPSSSFTNFSHWTNYTFVSPQILRKLSLLNHDLVLSLLQPAGTEVYHPVEKKIPNPLSQVYADWYTEKGQEHNQKPISILFY